MFACSAVSAAPAWGAATYAAPTGTVATARQKVEGAFKSWARSVSDHAIAVDQNPDDPPIAPVLAVRVTTGVGKSYRAQRAAVDLVRDLRSWGEMKKSVALAVPRHVLADEFAADLSALADGLMVRVYRGRGAADPDAPGQAMCRRAREAAAVQLAAGASSKRFAGMVICAARSSTSAGRSASGASVPTSGSCRMPCCGGPRRR